MVPRGRTVSKPMVIDPRQHPIPVMVIVTRKIIARRSVDVPFSVNLGSLSFFHSVFLLDIFFGGEVQGNIIANLHDANTV